MIINADTDQAVRCLSCGKSYHKGHFEDACHYCSGTTVEMFVPTSQYVARNVIRKPKRLKRVDLDDYGWEIRDYIDWAGSLALATARIGLGIAISTIVGAFTFRFLNYGAHSEPVAYLNSIIRSELPSEALVYVSLIAAVLGAFVFFPSKLPTRTQPHSSDRRLWRFTSIIVVLFGVNLVLLGLNFNDIVPILSSELQISLGTAGFTFLAAQGGALVATMLIGSTIRSRNELVYMWKTPKNLKRFLIAINVMRFYAAAMLTVMMAFLLTTNLLPTYRLATTTVEFGGWVIETNFAHMAALACIVFIALLLYHPPDHSKAERKWWLFRFVGCGIALMSFVNSYRSASSSELEAIMQAGIAAIIIAICLVPVQRTLS
jgi:hypothetical protein